MSRGESGGLASAVVASSGWVGVVQPSAGVKRRGVNIYLAKRPGPYRLTFDAEGKIDNPGFDSCLARGSCCNFLVGISGASSRQRFCDVCDANPGDGDPICDTDVRAWDCTYKVVLVTFFKGDE